MLDVNNLFIAEGGAPGKGFFTLATGRAKEVREEAKSFALAYAETPVKVRVRRMTREEVRLYYPINAERQWGAEVPPASEEYLECLAEANW